jgi:primosomal protein N' (replication factor Y)
MALLRIAVPSPLRRLFDYQSTDNTLPKRGCRVKVPFGRRELIGICLEHPEQTDLPETKLKPAIEILDQEPPLPDYLLDLVLWAADYYQHPVGNALYQALPGHLRKGAQQIESHHTVLKAKESASLEAIAANAHKQRAALSLILEHPLGISRDAYKIEGGDTSALNALFKKDLIEEVIAKAHWPKIVTRELPLPTNQEQTEVLKRIHQAQGFSPMLLEGITGSGKTEVYLQAIQQVLEQGKQALVLVPEIGLTPQTVSRFKARFSVPVVAMHSNLTDKQRYEAWVDAKSGRAGIIIGTRSSIFTPLKHPGILIIDEEHDTSFKQQEGFRYCARDLAIVRAHAEEIPVILGSATPSLETLNNALQGRYQHLRLTERAGNAKAPSIRLLDIRGAHLQNGISQATFERIRAHLDQGTQVLVFLNRRGFAPSLSCHDCGWIAECRRCDAKMTLHYQPAHLHCHHCDSQRPVPLRCDQCGSDQIKPQGAGTERTQLLLEEYFPDVEVLRVDRDSTARKGSLNAMMDQIHTGKPCILVGTQMLAKGHHFPKVTLVVILEADAGLFSTDFRGMERTAQLITQVAGRAGRAEDAGEVIIQTHHAEHPQLMQLTTEGYAAFARQELALRQSYQQPPFRHMAVCRAETNRKGTAESFLRSLRDTLEPQFAGIEWLGPFPSPMEKKAGVFRAQLILSAHSRPALQNSLSHLCLMASDHPSQRKVRWSVDVDPYDLS